MIISENANPSLSEFRDLMKRTDILLNDDARGRPEYYANRGGSALEDDVKIALEECAMGTPFQGTIIKVSGQRFPDIIASKLYGVEVKSTKADHWTSTGSSIMESTRVQDVERIYMTFGKLGGTVQFLSRPYEECLSGIAVTHSPRYLIDMKLQKGETIFDKMKIDYDALRQMENPIAPVSNYYRSKLKPGESLWWAGDAPDESVSAKIRLWKNVSLHEKMQCKMYGCVNYPEIFGGDYDRYALWLTAQGIVDSHIRDQFSAGGQEQMKLRSGVIVSFPGVYRRVKKNLPEFMYRISRKDPTILADTMRVERSVLRKRLVDWIDTVSKCSSMEYEVSKDALETLLLEGL